LSGITDTREEGRTILVIADDEELRESLEEILRSDGYRVCSARREQDGIEAGMHFRPALILISLNRPVHEMRVVGSRIRSGAGLGQAIPVVMFCIVSLAYGEQLALGENIYATRLDNFDQLRRLLSRLLSASMTG
jgi:CheY-like chemotaxis protein